MERKINLKFLGIDGCKAGWVSAIISNENNLEFTVFSSIKEIWALYSDAIRILIYIPIGLIHRGSEPRLCDKLARKVLKWPRSSSIFSPPCRNALYTKNYEKANEINHKWTKKGLSKQAWYISSKIGEVDQFLSRNMLINQILLESHPELCFLALNNQKAMKFNKKTSKGFQERLLILKKHSSNMEYDLAEIMSKYPKKLVQPDDILDAWVMAITASHDLSALQSFPESPDFDSRNLPMRIVCLKK